MMGGNTMQTTMTTNVGTIFYISPETFQSSTKISNKTDVYSFAIVMYEVLFLENPYLNAHSKKIHHFRPAVYGEDVAFTVPTRVMRGERPVVPFEGRGEFEEWMGCYGGDGGGLERRPEFSQISMELQELMNCLCVE